MSDGDRISETYSHPIIINQSEVYIHTCLVQFLSNCIPNFLLQLNMTVDYFRWFRSHSSGLALTNSISCSVFIIKINNIHPLSARNDQQVIVCAVSGRLYTLTWHKHVTDTAQARLRHGTGTAHTRHRHGTDTAQTQLRHGVSTAQTLPDRLRILSNVVVCRCRAAVVSLSLNANRTI
jgi:hypothetical protein